MICMALSETIRCRNSILGRGIGWGCWHVISLYDLGFLDLTLNLAKCRKFYLVSLLVLGCRCAISQCDLGVTFYLGSARMFSAAIFETYFSYHKDVWITVGDAIKFSCFDPLSLHTVSLSQMLFLLHLYITDTVQKTPYLCTF